MKITNDPYCRWCHNQEEDIEHLILHCPRFHSSRTKLKEALRKIKVINPNINLLFTGADLSPTEKFYTLTHQNLSKKKQINRDHVKERIEKKKDPGDIDYAKF